MKLAGIPALDFTMASRTMAFDPVRKDWVPSILEYVGIVPANLETSHLPVCRLASF
jgi:glycerol kinase